MVAIAKPEARLSVPASLPDKQWIPSNATVGYSFLNHYCGNCARDKEMREGTPYDECDDNECCDIIARSFNGEAIEWRVDAEGGRVYCMMFVPEGEPIPEPRCEHTADMFEEATA